MIQEASENLQLYFQLGDILNFQRFDHIVSENFVEKAIFPEEITVEMKAMKKKGVRIDFVHIAHRIYKRKGVPKNFQQGVIRCKNLIQSCYSLNVLNEDNNE